MKKKLLVIALASLLSAPSIVFAQAEWYGSFRAGVQTGPTDAAPNGDTILAAPGSRWGVRGSNEISDGLRGVYRYEEALDLRTATLTAGNRLSFVGLSGGFGTLTMGRVWGAEYNTTGVILDNSYFHGSSQGTYRVGPALSYAVDAGPVSMQLDAVMDGSSTEEDLANPTVGIGTGANNCGTGAGITANTRCLRARTGDDRLSKEINAKTIDRILFGLSANFGSGKVAVSYDSHDTFDKDVIVPAEGTGANVVPDVKKTNLTVAGEYTFGSTRVYLGYSQLKEAGDYGVAANTQERKTTSTFAGVGGSFSDTGLSYLLQVVQRKRDTGGTAAAAKPTPILLTVAYSLGGSSTIIFEGVTNDKTFAGAKTKATAGLYLKVDF